MEDKKLRQLNFAEAFITMPKSLIVGDPSYFEEGDLGKKYTYEKSFEKYSKWAAYISISEDEYECEFEGHKMTYTSLFFNLYLAPNERILNTYKDGKIFKGQKIKTIEIGVDTAEYLLGSGENITTIHTASDGYFGGIQELTLEGRLSGIIVDLGLGENDFKDMKKVLESIFEFKFSK